MEDKIEQDATYNAVRAWISVWQESLVHYGPGTIDLELDRLAVIPKARADAVALLAAISDDLGRLEEKVPASILQRRCRAHRIVFFDISVEVFSKAIAKLVKLLE